MLSADRIFSAPNCDRHGQYPHVIICSGKKTLIYWPKMTDQDWKDLFQDGQNWQRGKREAVIFTAGGVFIMPPGTPHVVITLDVSHALVDPFLDELTYSYSLNVLIRQFEARMTTTNQDVVNELKLLWENSEKPLKSRPTLADAPKLSSKVGKILSFLHSQM